jgi:riboflavin kinase/FMN adenylyltransferase
VIASAREAAHEMGAALGVAVFTPHPRRFFQPDLPPFRLQSDAQRARALAGLGVEQLYEIGFDAVLAAMGGEQFVTEVLIGRLGVKHVSVGAEFRFGRGRSADVDKLRKLGEAHGFSVEAVAPIVGKQPAKISSSMVRDFIANGDMLEACLCLTRHWAIAGEVQMGFQRGRGFGVATANMALGEYVRPRFGVYAVRVDIGDGAKRPGVASVGVNPTVGALPQPVLETHLFDFDAELYGRTIEVEMHAFLRDEVKFDTMAAMVHQIRADIAEARALLGC